MKKNNSYFGIWMLLSVALVGFIILSFAEEIKIAEWSPRKAPFKEALLRDNEAEEAARIEEKLRLDSIRNYKPKAEVDSTPKSILLIGDSMTMNLAYRLSKYAKANGHTFHAVNWDSSNTKTWASCDTLEHFMREYDVDYVFISLGSNELTMKNPYARLQYVRMLLDKIGEVPYVWIGPPNWTQDFGINDMIQQNCRPGAFFLTNGMKLARKKDKIHPTRDASAEWIDSLARWIPKSAHPIMMKAPDDSIGKVNPNVIFLKARNK